MLAGLDHITISLVNQKVKNWTRVGEFKRLCEHHMHVLIDTHIYECMYVVPIKNEEV